MANICKNMLECEAIALEEEWGENILVSQLCLMLLELGGGLKYLVTQKTILYGFRCTPSPNNIQFNHNINPNYHYITWKFFWSFKIKS